MLGKIPSVYVVIVNWNRWYDTVECLESLFRSNYSNFHVLVVDNGSSDESIDRLCAWAEGKLDVYVPNSNPLKSLSFPPLKKPVPYGLYTGPVKALQEKQGDFLSNDLVFIDAVENKGYAAGNNIAIKLIIDVGDYDYVWLLNGDTVVEKDALKELVNFAEAKGIDVCGSVLKYYSNPGLIQACGGRVNKYFGTSTHIICMDEVDSKLDYIVGASLLISKKSINCIGLLPEEYFLYYEETDFCFQARASGLKLGIAKESVVYHKEGGATGASNDAASRSEYSDLLILKNRVRFHKKWLGGGLGLWMGILISLLLRVKRGQVRRVIKFVFWLAHRTI